MRLFSGLFFRFLSTALAVLFFAGNVVLAHAFETNFWTARSAAISPTTTKSPTRKPLSSPLIKKLSGLTTPAEDLRTLLQSIPPQFGTVRKISYPKNKANANGKVVLHLQDVHHNEEAQKNIGSLTTRLFDKGEIDVVGLEGAFGPIDLSRFRSFKNREVIRNVADYSLKNHFISGPIHAVLTNPNTIPPIVGVDQKSSYDANVEAYKASSQLFPQTKTKLETLNRLSENRKKEIFNSDLLALDAQTTQFRHNKIKLGEYLDILSSHTDFPPTSIELYTAALELEEKLEPKRVESERTRLLKHLTSKLTQDETQLLLDASVAFRTGRVNQTEFYQYLKKLCSQKKVPLTRFTAMNDYIQYLLISDQIDTERLFDDLKNLEKSVYTTLIRTEEERNLVDQSNQLHLSSKLIEFALTPEEWSEYSNIRIFENSLNLSSYEEFYKQAEIRDERITSNLINQLENQKGKTALLVTGGFHTPGITQQLTDKNFTVVTLAPTITQVETDKGSQYLSVFTREKTPLEKLFEGEKLFLTTHPVGSIESLASRGVALQPNLPAQTFNALTGANATPKQITAESNGDEVKVTYKPKRKKNRAVIYKLDKSGWGVPRILSESQIIIARTVSIASILLAVAVYSVDHDPLAAGFVLLAGAGVVLALIAYFVQFFPNQLVPVYNTIRATTSNRLPSPRDLLNRLKNNFIWMKDKTDQVASRNPQPSHPIRYPRDPSRGVRLQAHLEELYEPLFKKGGKPAIRDIGLSMNRMMNSDTTASLLDLENDILKHLSNQGYIPKQGFGYSVNVLGGGDYLLNQHSQTVNLDLQSGNSKEAIRSLKQIHAELNIPFDEQAALENRMNGIWDDKSLEVLLEGDPDDAIDLLAEHDPEFFLFKGTELYWKAHLDRNRKTDMKKPERDELAWQRKEKYQSLIRNLDTRLIKRGGVVLLIEAPGRSYETFLTKKTLLATGDYYDITEEAFPGDELTHQLITPRMAGHFSLPNRTRFMVGGKITLLRKGIPPDDSIKFNLGVQSVGRIPQQDPAFRKEKVIHDGQIAYFNRIAERYVQKRARLIQRHVRTFRQMFLNIVPQKGLIIDAGSTGRDAAYFQSKGREAVAFNNSPGVVHWGHENYPDVDIREMDMVELDFDDESAAGVWDPGSFNHLTPPSAIRALSEFRRVLKSPKRNKETHVWESGLVFLRVRLDTFPRTEEDRDIPEDVGVEKVIFKSDDKSEFLYYKYYKLPEFVDLIHNNGFRVLQSGVRKDSPMEGYKPDKDLRWGWVVAQVVGDANISNQDQIAAQQGTSNVTSPTTRPADDRGHLTNRQAGSPFKWIRALKLKHIILTIAKAVSVGGLIYIAGIALPPVLRILASNPNLALLGFIHLAVLAIIVIFLSTQFPNQLNPAFAFPNGFQLPTSTGSQNSFVDLFDRFAVLMSGTPKSKAEPLIEPPDNPTPPEFLYMALYPKKFRVIRESKKLMEMKELVKYVQNSLRELNELLLNDGVTTRITAENILKNFLYTNNFMNSSAIKEDYYKKRRPTEAVLKRHQRIISDLFDPDPSESSYPSARRAFVSLFYHHMQESDLSDIIKSHVFTDGEKWTVVGIEDHTILFQAVYKVTFKIEGDETRTEDLFIERQMNPAELSRGLLKTDVAYMQLQNEFLSGPKRPVPSYYESPAEKPGFLIAPVYPGDLLQDALNGKKGASIDRKSPSMATDFARLIGEHAAMGDFFGRNDRKSSNSHVRFDSTGKNIVGFLDFDVSYFLDHSRNYAWIQEDISRGISEINYLKLFTRGEELDERRNQEFDLLIEFTKSYRKTWKKLLAGGEKIDSILEKNFSESERESMNLVLEERRQKDVESVLEEILSAYLVRYKIRRIYKWHLNDIIDVKANAEDRERLSPLVHEQDLKRELYAFAEALSESIKRLTPGREDRKSITDVFNTIKGIIVQYSGDEGLNLLSDEIEEQHRYAIDTAPAIIKASREDSQQDPETNGAIGTVWEFVFGLTNPMFIGALESTIASLVFYVGLSNGIAHGPPILFIAPALVPLVWAAFLLVLIYLIFLFSHFIFGVVQSNGKTYRPKYLRERIHLAFRASNKAIVGTLAAAPFIIGTAYTNIFILDAGLILTSIVVGGVVHGWINQTPSDRSDFNAFLRGEYIPPENLTSLISFLNRYVFRLRRDYFEKEDADKEKIKKDLAQIQKALNIANRRNYEDPVMSRKWNQEWGSFVSDYNQTLMRDLIRLARELKIDRGRPQIKVLDVGAGPGNHTEFMHQMDNVEADAVEYAGSFQRELKKKDIGRIFKANMEDLRSVPDEEYDVVRIQAALIHSLNAVPGIGADLVITEALKKLKRGGVLYLFVKEGEGLWSNKEGRIFQLFDKPHLKNLLDRNGLTFIESDTTGDPNHEGDDKGRLYAIGQKANGTDEPFLLSAPPSSAHRQRNVFLPLTIIGVNIIPLLLYSLLGPSVSTQPFWQLAYLSTIAASVAMVRYETGGSTIHEIEPSEMFNSGRIHHEALVQEVEKPLVELKKLIDRNGLGREESWIKVNKALAYLKKSQHLKTGLSEFLADLVLPMYKKRRQFNSLKPDVDQQAKELWEQDESHMKVLMSRLERTELAHSAAIRRDTHPRLIQDISIIFNEHLLDFQDRSDAFADLDNILRFHELNDPLPQRLRIDLRNDQRVIKFISIPDEMSFQELGKAVLKAQPEIEVALSQLNGRLTHHYYHRHPSLNPAPKPEQIKSLYAEVQQAEKDIRPLIGDPTPLIRAPRLEKKLGSTISKRPHVYIKLEGALPAGSYKLRPIANSIVQFFKRRGESLGENFRGFVRHTTGNNGLALGYIVDQINRIIAQVPFIPKFLTSIKAFLFAPKGTPDVKLDPLRKQDSVELDETSADYDGAKRLAQQYLDQHSDSMHRLEAASEDGLIGAATAGQEILEQLKVDHSLLELSRKGVTIVVPVANGGLTQIGIPLLANHIPTTVVGVQSEEHSALIRNLIVGQNRYSNPASDPAREISGINIKKPTDDAFQNAQTYLDAGVIVNYESTVEATALAFEDVRGEMATGAPKFELASGLGAAALLTENPIDEIKNARIIVVVASGSNVEENAWKSIFHLVDKRLFSLFLLAMATLAVSVALVVTPILFPFSAPTAFLAVVMIIPGFLAHTFLSEQQTAPTTQAIDANLSAVPTVNHQLAKADNRGRIFVKSQQQAWQGATGSKQGVSIGPDIGDRNVVLALGNYSVNNDQGLRNMVNRLSRESKARVLVPQDSLTDYRTSLNDLSSRIQFAATTEELLTDSNLLHADPFLAEVDKILINEPRTNWVAVVPPGVHFAWDPHLESKLRSSGLAWRVLRTWLLAEPVQTRGILNILKTAIESTKHA